jgi:hypothetical protein
MFSLSLSLSLSLSAMVRKKISENSRYAIAWQVELGKAEFFKLLSETAAQG